MDGSNPTQHSPRIVTFDEAEELHPFGHVARVVMPTEATDGAFSMLHFEHQPHKGAPLHSHLKQDEFFYILKGTYQTTLNGETKAVGPGTTVFIPRGTKHSVTALGNVPCQMLDWSLPGGQDRYFREITDEIREKNLEGGFSDEVMEIVAAANDRHATTFYKPE